jgi:hypothetical protein
MASDEVIRVTINEPDKGLLSEVKKIAAGTEPNATLAKAILAVEDHCLSIQAALTTLVKKADFKMKT